MSTRRLIAVLLACSLVVLFAFTGCGLLNGDSEDVSTPTLVPVSDRVQAPSGREPAVGEIFTDFVDVVEALGKGYLAPITIEYFIGAQGKKFQEEYQFSIVCGQEIAIAHPALSLNRALAEQVLFNGLTDEEIRALPPEAFEVRADVYTGPERLALDESSALRINNLFIVSKVPEALTLTHVQRECNLEKEKFQNLRLYEDVYFIGSNGAGNKGFIPTADLKNSEGIFLVAVPVDNTFPGELVVVNRGGRPKILGMALQAIPDNPEFMLVAGIDTLFPPK